MLTRTVLSALALAGLTSTGAMAATVDQGVGYALGQGGRSLVILQDLANPTPSNEVQLTLNGNQRRVDAIAYRPNTNQFFGFQDGDESRDIKDTIYSIDVLTGELTRIIRPSGRNDAGQIVEIKSRRTGFDFNNMADAARAVSRQDENLVFFPAKDGDPASVIRANDLFYAAGDVNEGDNPSIFANAYTNAVPLPVSATQQYALDGGNDVLVTLANNEGTLETLGKLTVDGEALDFNSRGGFDILSPSFGDNLGIALLNVSGMSNLYSFELPEPGTTGDIAATFLGSIGTDFVGLAVAPADVAPIPVPASALLLLGGLGGLGVLRRRKKA